MKRDSSDLPVLLDDREAAIRELKAALGGDAATWTRAPAGRWSAAQHAEHLAKTAEAFVDRFEETAPRLRDGTLGSPPRRGFFQRLVVRMLMREPFPRGGKAASFTLPGPAPSREALWQRLDEAAMRSRRLVDALNAEERERLWIVNPFREGGRWHYRLFEAVRVETTHLRHHLRLAVAAMKASG